MSDRFCKTLNYWRASAADAALGKGCFSRHSWNRGPKKIRLTRKELEEGKLSDRSKAALFGDKAAKPAAAGVSVLIRPLAANLRLSHGFVKSNSLPEIVAPVVIDAKIRPEGEILPSRIIIARDALRPLAADNAFSLGDIDDFDGFSSRNRFDPGEDPAVWNRYWRDMLDAVTKRSGWPDWDKDYESDAAGGYLEKRGGSAEMVIISLYNAILARRKERGGFPLLRKLISGEQVRGGPRTEAGFTGRLGHASGTFPLAESQRRALSCLSAAGDGDVLAVNGPPGTGKTTMLLSAVAHEWVRSALNEDEWPKVIVAAAANNQAVTNIIDAFGRDFGEGEEPFRGRWLPEIEGYGMFLPSKGQLEKGADEKYHTDKRFFEKKLETRGYAARARKAYLKKGREAFPALSDPDVSAVTAALHERMKREYGLLKAAEKARALLAAKASEIAGDGCSAAVLRDALSNLENAARERAARLERAEIRDAARRNHAAGESAVLAVFGFLPAVERIRSERMRLALEAAGAALGVSAAGSVREIEALIRREVRESRRAAAGAESALREVREALDAWKDAARGLNASGGHPSAARLQDCADTGPRFRLFRLACHYWEGRWLLAMDGKPGKGIIGSKGRIGRPAAEPRWRMRMMLAPCAVATFHTLPARMLARFQADGDGSGYDYLFGFIDLLIVDEAGQALPETAAASFSLAKKALVIGDARQIEPVESLSESVDIGNLRRAGLLTEQAGGKTEEALDRLSETGVRHRGGSAMRLARHACGFHAVPELARGLWLLEHRRCYDEIIEYCSELCYARRLEPMRGAAPEEKTLPPMGYFHVGGMAREAGGSRFNPIEAEAAAAWLAENRGRLEDYYGGRRLEDIAAVVTPFGVQAREIGKECRRRGVGGGMTIGTVHSLQGAEREVVLFSPVYSSGADGGFIDMSKSMLNVAVSRAKDHFLVFGDMDRIFQAERGTPRRVLGERLRTLAESMGESRVRLNFDFRPRTRGAGEPPLHPELSAPGAPPLVLRNAAEHDRFLTAALGEAADRVSVSSPWIVKNNFAELLPAFEESAGRGVAVTVYFDPAVNGCPQRLSDSLAALKETGVRTRGVDRLHSKVVMIDDNRLCIGSFNWLSAVRDARSRFHRHETSMLFRDGPGLPDEIRRLRDGLEAGAENR